MNKIYVRAKCTNCKFVRAKCGLNNGKFTDNAGYTVLMHLNKTGHIIELQIGNEWAQYQLTNFNLIQVKSSNDPNSLLL